MNTARLAELYREQARISAEIADALEADDDSDRPRAKRLRSMPRPTGQASAAVAGLAAKALRDRGFR